MTEDDKRSRVLVVDDVLANVKILVLLLRSDHEVSVATSGEAALAVVDRELPDLVLLDVMMPLMDGYEVCRRLKASERTREIPVIFVTAKDEAEDEAKGFEMGAVDYITKPFSRAVVQARVRNHLDLKRHRDVLQGMMVALAKSRDEALALSRAKSNFLATMSHEIRTPMNSIIGMTELVLEGESDPTRRNQLGTAVAAARSLLGLINNILDLSKIESGKLQLESVVFDLRQTVEGAIAAVAILAQAKNLELTWRVEPLLPTCFHGDPTRLRQVLINLVSNAVKFTEGGGRVMVRVAGEGEGRVRFEVQDTGIGIPLAQQQRIFESFTQADQSTTRRYGGSGLGTTIAKEIVEKMGGRIWVESAEGRGSTFCFVVELPAALGVSACGGEGLGVRSAVGGGGVKRPLAILVAEDVEANQALVVARLVPKGHRVTVVGDGLQAVNRSAEEAFDVILMDLQMPVMDGMEATRLIRDRESRRGLSGHLPIIALTAHSMAGDRNDCLQAGMDDYVAKPIDFAELDRVLGRLFPGGEGVVPVAGSGSLPELAGITVEAGLSRWGDAEVYRRSLVHFGRHHAGDGARIRALLQAGDGPGALAAVHALKGAAGSLAADDLAAALAALEGALRRGEGEVDALMVSVAEALETVVGGCRGLESPAPEVGAPTSRPLGAVLPHQVEWLHRMAHALDHGDAMTAEGLLPELRQWLQGSVYEPEVERMAALVEEINCQAAGEALALLVTGLGVVDHGE